MRIVKTMAAILRSSKIRTRKPDSMKSLHAFLLCSAISFTYIQPATASEWQVSPSFFAGVEYLDNFNLNTTTQLEVWRSVFSGGIESEYRTGRGGIVFDGRYRGSRYITNDNLNQDEGLVNFLFDYSGEVDLWELDAGVKLEQPSSSQLEAGNQIFDIISRRRWHVTPSWTRELNEYNDLKLSYSYENTVFDDIPTPTTFFSDYFYHLASATFTHHFSDYTDLLGIGSYSRTTNDSLQFSSDRYSIEAGVAHKASETLNFYFTAGANWLVSKPDSTLVGNVTRNTNVDYVLSFKAEKQLENTSLTLGYDRYLAPSFGGGYVIRNQISTLLRQQFSDHLTGLIVLRANQSDTIRNTLSRNGQQNVSAKIELTWEFLENWLLKGGYQYAWQDINSFSTAGPGKQNTVFLSVRYELSPYFIVP